MPEYEARCPECEIAWAGASDRELLELSAPETCSTCGADLETVVID